MFSKDELLNLHIGLQKYIESLEDNKKDTEEELEYYLSLEDKDSEAIEIIADDSQEIVRNKEEINKLKLLDSKLIYSIRRSYGRNY